MKTLHNLFFIAVLIIFTACAGPEFRTREPVTDAALNGTWLIQTAELGGKSLPIPSTFELQINGTQYRAGIPPANDRGKLILFGDELVGQAARMDVVGEEGPNKGKRYPAIYRFNGSALEICYDLSEKERPTEFVSREGTLLLKVTYDKK